MRSLKPSQVRARILREHSALRRQLVPLAALAARLEADAPGVRALALEHVEGLYRALRDHIDFEDPLREIDAWGPVRADELLEHHARQRLEIAVLAERSGAESATGLARLIASLVSDLRADMTHEDCDMLSADLLRDDVVLIDAEAG